MRYNTDMQRKPQQWKRWFAWHPVWVGDVSDCNKAWLEVVERKKVYRYSSKFGMYYTYRTIEKI